MPSADSVGGLPSFSAEGTPDSPRHSVRPSRHTRVHPSSSIPPPSPSSKQQQRHQQQQSPPPPYEAPSEPLVGSSAPTVFIRSAGSPPRWEKKASWARLGDAAPSSPATGSLVAGGVVLLVSGVLTCLLCFYGLSQGGQRYYLDFGLLSGFSSVVIGSLGIRARTWQRSPNRNYVTGYVVLSFFSVLTTAGLVILNFGKLQSTSKSTPGSSSPLLDLVGGAECGIAVLTVALAVIGLILLSTSRGGLSRCLTCCGDPPPDDRVAHRAEGFTL